MDVSLALDKLSMKSCAFIAFLMVAGAVVSKGVERLWPDGRPEAADVALQAPTPHEQGADQEAKRLGNEPVGDDLFAESVHDRLNMWRLPAGLPADVALQALTLGKWEVHEDGSYRWINHAVLKTSADGRWAIGAGHVSPIENVGDFAVVEPLDLDYVGSF